MSTAADCSSNKMAATSNMNRVPPRQHYHHHNHGGVAAVATTVTCNKNNNNSNNNKHCATSGGAAANAASDDDGRSNNNNNNSASVIMRINNPNVSDESLLRFAKSLTNESKGPREANVEIPLNLAMQVLQTRKLHPKLEREFEKLCRKVGRDTAKCRCDGPNAQEVAGVPAAVLQKFRPDSGEGGTGNSNNNNKLRACCEKDLLHIYGHAVRKMYQRWQRSRSNRLDWPEFLAAKMSHDEKIRVLRRNAIVYLTPQQASIYKVRFCNGLVVRSNGQEYRNGRWMFVLDQTGQDFYIAKKRKGRFHHTSFVAGAPVQCAGFVTFKHGKMELLRLHSGHYKPTREHATLLRKFLADPSRLGAAAMAEVRVSLYNED